ncbi:TRAP transporter substrate-binding protein DctP [Sulfitobacter sp. D35]|uniref:TRAP transporter substrate-binding protein DctP n=1 Tax=Sulfitobacter sp. D35 TaxID=3083252 RepID=UPI00296FBA41|nr:TRAP transporter substrate-binding protein DctP [Sulfitobacter sp. D35]MDW4499193.1 TRAP transporter substrate-binding protein DctP [Sulfitobacter sp. D35]
MRHILFGTVTAGALAASAVSAQDVVTAVHAFPATLIYTKSFLEFVDKVNAAGEGVVQIEVRGGPEAIGMFQQPDAVRDGVVDMVYTPGSFYGGTLPEKDALVASNLTGPEARASGGIDLIDEIHQEKMGVKYLGWFDSNVCYNLWMVNEPQFDADGNLSVDGIKLRGNAVYNAFFTDYLGAQVIDLPTTDVYAGLERGVVDATGWTQIGLMDLKWNEFVQYRIDPCFFSTDLGVIMNLERWNALSDEARTILTETAIAHEAETAERLGAKAEQELAALEEAGMTTIALEGEARDNYLAAARQTTWDRMKQLMEESPQGAGNYDRLIELFYDPALD